MIQHAGGIIRKQRHGIRRIRLIALAHATVVKCDRPERLGKAVNIPVPADRAYGETHDEEQWLALPLFFVVQLDSI